MVEVLQRHTQPLCELTEVVSIEHIYALVLALSEENVLGVLHCSLEEHFLKFIGSLLRRSSLLFFDFHVHSKLYIAELLQLNVSRLAVFQHLLQ